MSNHEPSERSLQVASVFDAVAKTYDAVGVDWFQPIAERLVQEMAPRAGERALDVGCGRGAALFPLAESVGTQGRVVGIDLSAAMVERTRADVRARGLKQVELHVMDAAAPDLSDAAFDLVTASLVVFFLPDPGDALSRWRSLLRPGGRLGISTFSLRDPAWKQLDDLFLPYLPPHLLDARTSGQAGPFASDVGVEDLLTSAGYDEVRTSSAVISPSFADPDQWYDWTWSHGQRIFWLAVPEAERDDIKRRAYAILEECRDDSGRISLTQTVRFTVGRHSASSAPTPGSR